MTHTPRELRIHFDLSGEEPWHRREWEQRLARLSQGPAVGAWLVERPDQADAIIATVPSRARNRGGPPHFVWDSGDFPSGREPGFYCSLPRTLYDPRRHRSFCYPICYNECVQPADPAEADHLVGFVGGVTSGVRARLLTVLRRDARPGECLLQEQGGPWTQMFDRTGLAVKKSYAAALRRSRFFLCPRGNGTASIRLFETLQTGRVPVVISDRYVPPVGIDWASCALFVSESRLDRLMPLLRERAADWPALAAGARRAWDEHYADDALLRSLVDNLAELGIPPPPENPTAPLRRAFHSASLCTRRHLGALRSLFSP